MAYPSSSASREGFSLAELCIVIAILAILLAIAFVNMSRGRANATLNGAAVEMSNVLKYAREVAISSNGASVTFGAQECSVSAGGRTTKRIAIPAGVALSVPNSMNPLVFAANGSASTAGSLTLQSTSTGRTATLSVQAVAGTVSLTVR